MCVICWSLFAAPTFSCFSPTLSHPGTESAELYWTLNEVFHAGAPILHNINQVSTLLHLLIIHNDSLCHCLCTAGEKKPLFPTHFSDSIKKKLKSIVFQCFSATRGIMY